MIAIPVGRRNENKTLYGSIRIRSKFTWQAPINLSTLFRESHDWKTQENARNQLVLVLNNSDWLSMGMSLSNQSQGKVIKATQKQWTVWLLREASGWFGTGTNFSKPLAFMGKEIFLGKCVHMVIFLVVHVTRFFRAHWTQLDFLFSSSHVHQLFLVKVCLQDIKYFSNSPPHKSQMVHPVI